MLPIEVQLATFQEQVKTALKLGKRISLKDVDKIVVGGIGGSGVAGSLLKDYLLDKIRMPVITARNSLPKSSRRTLFLIVSYSGNTAETIRLYKMARKVSGKIAVITSGGKLSRSKEAVIVPKGFAPRLATLSLFFTMLTLVGKGRMPGLKAMDIKSSMAKSIARKLKGKMPVIYAPEKYRSIAYKWKTDFNETSKVFAHSNCFTELCHNEIEANLPKGSRLLILAEKNSRQIKKANRLLKGTFVQIKGKDMLSRLCYGVALGALVSYHLALLNKKDPINVPRIAMLKN